MQDSVLYIIVFIFGLIVGSFLNVCIFRIPRGKSIIMPSSHCPSCNTPINIYDNIPILSYIILGRRCRTCGAKISARYPAVEAANALFYIALIWRFGIGWHTFFYFMFASALIVITFIDIDFQIIPDTITLPGIVLGLAAGAFVFPDPFLRWSLLGYKGSVIGAVTGFLSFYAVAVLSRGGMGGGDIKMMTMVGAIMGWKSVLLTTFLGSFLGSIWGISLMIFKGKGRKTKIPFGPFLAAGTMITLFSGQEILHWYLRIR
ncbi:MAG: prepilin peptidase [Nitrospirae bacterium]|nr:prepilin peptidase [Nitrospirota bacterium]